MGLYKYTNLTFIPSCIENGIYASCLDNINDPFEGKGIRYKNDFRVVCLTSSSLQMLMWAYYVNHKGCCIEFDISGINGIRKVEYIKEFQNHEDMNTKEIIESLYKKGYEWNHEKEFRLVYHKYISDNNWVIDGKNIFLKAPVKKILFGYAAEMDPFYHSAIRCIYNYNKSHKQKIEVSKCKLMRNKYQLETDKQYNLESEIAEFNNEINQIKCKNKVITEHDKVTVFLQPSLRTVSGDTRTKQYRPRIISGTTSQKPNSNILEKDDKIK